MSEYQRYEFVTVDRPLTQSQLDAVDGLSSHIEASSTHAFIEYHWGDFKYDPIEVLHDYFDAFLYWANWGSRQLAFRFPHGVLPGDFIKDYDLDEYVTFTQHQDYDVLDFDFKEMEAEEWPDYELGPLIPIREELMEGDLRALYIAWLAAQRMIWGYDYDYTGVDDEEEEESEEEDDELAGTPPVPPDFGKLTQAQQALAELLEVPSELLAAAAKHSSAGGPSMKDDFAAWVDLLPEERRKDYLVRLARNEPGLSRLLVRELRELGLGKTKATPAQGERVTYAQLLAESAAIQAQIEHEKREQARLAHQRRMQELHDYQNTYWRQVDQAAAQGTASGYDRATQLLVELREAADYFKETNAFLARFLTWVQSHQRRPALLRRLQEHHFVIPAKN